MAKLGPDGEIADLKARLEAKLKKAKLYFSNKNFSDITKHSDSDGVIECDGGIECIGGMTCIGCAVSEDAKNSSSKRCENGAKHPQNPKCSCEFAAIIHNFLCYLHKYQAPVILEYMIYDEKVLVDCAQEPKLDLLLENVNETECKILEKWRSDNIQEVQHTHPLLYNCHQIRVDNNALVRIIHKDGDLMEFRGSDVKSSKPLQSIIRQVLRANKKQAATQSNSNHSETLPGNGNGCQIRNGPEAVGGHKQVLSWDTIFFLNAEKYEGWQAELNKERNPLKSTIAPVPEDLIDSVDEVEAESMTSALKKDFYSIFCCFGWTFKFKLEKENLLMNEYKNVPLQTSPRHRNTRYAQSSRQGLIGPEWSSHDYVSPQLEPIISTRGHLGEPRTSNLRKSPPSTPKKTTQSIQEPYLEDTPELTPDKSPFLANLNESGFSTVTPPRLLRNQGHSDSSPLSRKRGDDNFELV